MSVVNYPVEDVCNCCSIAFKPNNKSALAIGSQRTVNKIGLSIASLNINGLKRHLDEIKVFLWEINIYILVLNETKFNASYPEQLTEISAYEQAQQKRNSKGGGIAVYVRDFLIFKKRKDVLMCDLELVYLDIELLKSRPFIIIAWYRSPSSSVDLFAKTEKVLSFLDGESKEVIILDDTNCDLTT